MHDGVDFSGFLEALGPVLLVFAALKGSDSRGTRAGLPHAIVKEGNSALSTEGVPLPSE